MAAVPADGQLGDGLEAPINGGIMETGRLIEITYQGKAVRIFNQRSRLWTHPYDYKTPQKATLSSAGCGVFSICHCGQWLTGNVFSPEELADFSRLNGGRGDDGTDRPALLSAMMAKGLAAQYGFAYQGDGLRNDLDVLRAHLLGHYGVALCNLRVGHIVSLLDARERDGQVQALALDSYSESMEEKIRSHVIEVIENSAVDTLVRNEAGLITGWRRQYALYWVDSAIVRDYNLLHAI